MWISACESCTCRSTVHRFFLLFLLVGFFQVFVLFLCSSVSGAWTWLISTTDGSCVMKLSNTISLRCLGACRVLCSFSFCACSHSPSFFFPLYLLFCVISSHSLFCRSPLPRRYSLVIWTMIFLLSLSLSLSLSFPFFSFCYEILISWVPYCARLSESSLSSVPVFIILL